jgi:probable phosphoglycerate mutase
VISTSATCPDTVYFYLCRHGQSEFNAKGLLQGHLESPLTEKGIGQAQALALKAKHWKINHIVSSHLGRAQQTARICAQALNSGAQTLNHGAQGSLLIEPQNAKDLAERHLGDWQGKPIKQLPEFHTFNQLCYQQTHITPPNSLERIDSLERVNSPEPDSSPEQEDSLEQRHHTGHGESTDKVRERMLKALISIAYSKALTSTPSPVQHNVLVISHGDALACLMSMFTQPIPLKNTQGILLSYQNDRLEWGGFLD